MLHRKIRMVAFGFACSTGILFGPACAPPGKTAASIAVSEDLTAAALTASIDADGGVISGAQSELFRGVSLTVPSGAFAAKTTITIELTEDDTALPEAAHRVGTQFKLSANAAPKKPLRLTLPVDLAAQAEFGAAPDEVKVWVRTDSGWQLTEPLETTVGSVVIEQNTLTTVAAGVKLRAGATIACASCATQQVIQPAVGMAPQPCQVSGGFCVEPLTGGAGNPAPRPGRFGALIAGGRVTYTDHGVSGHVLQLRLSDLALFHGQGATVQNSGQNFSATTASLHTLFNGSVRLSLLPIANAAPQAQSNTIVGQSLGTNYARGTAGDRVLSFRTLGGSVEMQEIDTGGTRTPLKTAPGLAPIATLRSSQAGHLWILEGRQVADGSVSANLRRLAADGTTLTTIPDASNPAELVKLVGNDGSDTALVGGAVSYSDATQLIVSAFVAPADGSNHKIKLKRADLTQASPTLTDLNIPAPTADPSHAITFISVDSIGRYWFIWGNTGAAAVYIFNPANSTTLQVALADHRPVQLAADGPHMIVYALRTDNQGAGLFRIRDFGN